MGIRGILDSNSLFSQVCYQVVILSGLRTRELFLLIKRLHFETSCTPHFIRNLAVLSSDTPPVEKTRIISPNVLILFSAKIVE